MNASVTAKVVKLDGSTVRTVTGSDVAEALQKANIEPDPNTWIWLNPSNEEYSAETLEGLLEIVERSPSVGVLGPKQVSSQNSRIITQLGLTLTPLGDAFSPISGQLDQSQHDSLGDVLAVGVAGMFIRSDVVEIAGGWSRTAPALAEDIDFCIRVRMAGFRVVVAPTVSVTADGAAKTFGKRMKIEQRKAAIHLRIRFAPFALAIAYSIFLLPLSFLRVFYRLAQKRPDRIWSEIYCGFWGVFTVGARLGSRLVKPMLVATKLRAMKGLRATWEQVRADARSRAEQDEQAHNLAAFERGELEQTTSTKSFTAASGWLYMLLLAAASWQLFPTNQAATGAAVLPISNNLQDLFARAGASWQPIGTGFFAPSDPFNWILLALGSITFWAPQISIGVLLFLGRSLAFAAAWRALGLVTQRAWVKTLLAIAYAFWPSLTIALNEARIPAVVTAITLPLLLLSVARAAGVGRRGSARSDRQTWSWVAASGLSFAVVGISTPNLIPIALLVLAVAAFGKIRRFGYLFWIPLPLAALFTPYAVYLIAIAKHPLATLADPSIPYLSQKPELLFTSGLAAVALVAIATRRWVISFVYAMSAVILLVGAWAVSQISFSGTPGSSLGYLTGLGMVIVLLVGIAFDQAKRKLLIRLAAASLVALGIAPLGYQSLTAAAAWQYSDGRVVPWLLEVEADSNASLLVVEPTAEGYSLTWQRAKGRHLEDENTAYRTILSSHVASEGSYQEVADAVANLASANGVDVRATLQNYNTGYLLVPNTSSARAAELATALDSSPLLESAGVTPYGHLWRLSGFHSQSAESHSVWSITKAVQLAVLLGFVLLAIPSRRAGRKARDSEIFVGESEGES